MEDLINLVDKVLNPTADSLQRTRDRVTSDSPEEDIDEVQIKLAPQIGEA